MNLPLGRGPGVFKTKLELRNPAQTGQGLGIGHFGVRSSGRTSGKSSYLINRALDTLGLSSQGATAVIQGFGNVGSVTALTLGQSRVKILAVSDVEGGVRSEKGLNLAAVQQHVARHKTVASFPEAESITNEDLLITPCDILVPAAMERLITAANAGQIRCRILAEAANGPTTPEADRILDQRPEIFILPDILCNAGGVVVSYFEWVRDLQSFFWTETEVSDKLFRVLEPAFVQVLNLSRKLGISMRLAALSIGINRVHEAKQIRGLFP